MHDPQLMNGFETIAKKFVALVLFFATNGLLYTIVKG